MSAPRPLLSDLLSTHLPQARLCVAFSGGLDSTVLLHALASIPSVRAHGLRAWHVHHGLHADADRWAEHCAEVCAGLDVPLQLSRVEVRRDGEGLEAAARRARRKVFAEGLGEGEVLALAHHQDDQAETFLLRALRASGSDGLAGMRRWQPFGRGRLWRPLLDIPREGLAEYAAGPDLRWIEDPSNVDTAFDRNFLRREVLPLLRERWPQAGTAFARSAALCGEAADLLAAGDTDALASVHAGDRQLLTVAGLMQLPATRRARVLRAWVTALGLPPLPAAGIVRIESDLLAASADSDAAFAWSGATIRRWRDLLHAGMVRASLPADFEAVWDGLEGLTLPTGDQLRLQCPAGATSIATGISMAAKIAAHVDPAYPSKSHSRATADATGLALDMPVRVHARRGGERIRLHGRAHSHALKRVLQELGVAPWVRERLPLLSSADGELLAAGDLVRSARFDAWLQEHDARLLWIDAGLHGLRLNPASLGD